jgi:hypothetical protein
MAATDFTYETSELDFGPFCLGGDWLLKLSTDDDGFSFRLIDAESCSEGVSKAVFAVIQEWVDGDTAPRARGAKHKSLIRQAYEDALAERDDPGFRADDRAEWAQQFLPAAE